MEKLKRKYSLPTTISLVIGIVMGSGIFLKNIDITRNVGGNILISSFIFLLMGSIMIVSAYAFSISASRIEKVNGLVDYIEDASNEKVAFYSAYYFNFIFLPIITSALAFASASFFKQLIGASSKYFEIYFGILFLVLSFTVNILVPKIAGRFQIITTVVKLLPILLIGTIGLFISNKSDVEVISSFTETGKINFFKALLSAAFAYEGWIVSTTINAEVKNSKKNLPKALVIGSLITIVCFLVYNIGITFIIGSDAILISKNDQRLVEEAFSKVLNNNIGGKLFLFFVFVSCYGVLNGLTMGTSRGMYSVAIRANGKIFKPFLKLNKFSNTSIKSGIVGFLLSLFFLVYFFLAVIFKIVPGNIDEIAIGILYLTYIIVYVKIIRQYKDLSTFKRIIIPVLAIISAIFLVFATFFVIVNTLQDGSVQIYQKFPYILVIIGISLLWARYDYKRKEKALIQG